MEHRYGRFSNNQVKATKKSLRSQIFFLLLCVDPETKDEYKEVNVDDAFQGLLYKLGGLNSVLFYPKAMVECISLLEEARLLLSSSEYTYHGYRKCVLEAGKRILDIDALPSGEEEEVV